MPSALRPFRADRRPTLAIAALAGLALATLPVVGSFAFAPDQQVRLRQLVETGMQFYWTGGDMKKAEAEVFKGITLHGRYDVVEKAFTEAAAIAPERLDFRYAIASTQIIQKNVAGARATYADVLKASPAAFEAQAQTAALARVTGDADGETLAFSAMSSIDRERAALYRRLFARAESVLAERPNVEVPKAHGQVAIVVLGYALARDGSMQKPLLDRLEAARKAAEAYPAARIMVTGGQPQSGVTEGDVMMRWLVERGIDRDRIMIEDKSKDTVGNALNVAALLRRHGAEAIVLVTSSSHMRRARLLVEDALRQAAIAAPVLPIVALDAPSLDEAAKVSPDERLVVFRDLMRISGIWAYPGLQQ